MKRDSNHDHRSLGPVILKLSWRINEYYGLNVCALPLQNSYVKALISNVMVSRDGVFGRKLGLDEVLKVGPHHH